MVLTQSSKASNPLTPRTRTRTGARSSPLPLPLTPQRQRLIAKHAILYPITTRLGISGTKAEKRRTVNHSIRLELELYSPNPPRDSHLPVNHQGHNLSSPMMNVGATSERDAGSHYQLCRECGPPGGLRGCDGAVAKFSSSLSPFPVTILSLPNISQLFAARRELYTVARQPPSSARLRLSLTISINATARRSCAPPSAEVGNHSSSLTLFDDDDDMELQYPPTLELNFPVAVFIWINKSNQPIYQLLAPRERDVALEAAGLPDGCILQRYIDPTGDWIEFDWDNPIELYLSNRILYLRLYGLDITPPDHILELFTLN
ncbi:hypothetical protein B0H14DRAFT_3782437 [Mycena olivaceomarginata]|nr:hypothetical protein B0H14DRAFT_3782437 [Mycena olivaceomarginata]